MRALAVASVLAFGCLNGSYNGSPDMRMVLPPVNDMAVSYSFDLYGIDASGLTNCGALNKCEAMCTTAACALACRQNASPQALAKDAALQACFNQYCPRGMADMSAICTPDAQTGAFSQACQTCIQNTYVGANGTCTPASAPECHNCLGQATTCAQDQ
jgi:hypothetical protein